MLNIFELMIIRPLGFVIQLIYNLVQNYGLSIILFTIIIKLVVLPLTVKSQKAMKKQQMIQPIIAELQKKYANDKEKLQTEMMKVYKENNVSMMGGCLPTLIQLPILIALYQVIQKPLSYFLSVDFSTEESINKVIYLRDNMENIGALKTQTMAQLANNSQISLAKWSETLYGANDPWVINFNFLGVDLSNAPVIAVNEIMAGHFGQFHILSLILIPALAVLTTWLSTKQAQKMTQRKDQGTKSDDPAASMNKSMTMMMPIMTGFFTFTLPAGLGIYWIISNLVQIAQQYFINKNLEQKEDEFVVKVPEKNRKNSKKHR